MRSVYEVLSKEEIERIHAASMEILQTVGIKVDYATVRDLFRKAAAQVDEQLHSVRIPESLVRQAIDLLPKNVRFGNGPGRALFVQAQDWKVRMT